MSLRVSDFRKKVFQKEFGKTARKSEKEIEKDLFQDGKDYVHP